MSKISKVPPEHELALTSCKVHPFVLRQFQEQSLHKITLQKLLNRAMALYTYDKEFRATILGYTALVPSGSL